MSLLKNTLSILCLLFVLSGCDFLKKDVVSPKEEEEDTLITDAAVDAWIHAKMKEYYLWSDDMKGIDQTDISLKPDAYFESILVQPGEVDRFSWIQESSEELINSLNGITKVFGINQRPFYADDAQTKVALSISYTSKGGAADRAGIKRGDFITKVNGEFLTIDNYRTALSSNTVTVTLGTYVNGEILPSDKSVELTKEVTQLEAVHHYEVIELADKKIGYLAYMQFLTSSDKAMNDAFGEFKQKGINELVIDLRYNPGGYISSAALMSSLIVKGLKSNMLMSRQIWNAEQTKRYKDQYGDDVFNDYFLTTSSNTGALNNIGTLNRVFFLVSSGSASSSELVINNLKPYMEVILVGSNTYGKNVGSITIDDTQDPKRWQWGMQPIVLKTVNAKGESDYGTKEGFTPDFKVDDNRLPFKAFGDPEETLLKTALEKIVGEQVLAQARKGARISPSKEFSTLSSEGLYDNPLLNRKEMILDVLPGQ